MSYATCLHSIVSQYITLITQLSPLKRLKYQPGITAVAVTVNTIKQGTA